MNSWLKYLWETRPTSIIVSGIVTSAVAYGIYKLIKFLQESECNQEPDEYFRKVKNTRSERPRTRVLVVGLDGSGKTAFVECLSKGKEENVMPRPTVGFNVKSVTIGNVMFDIWDVGGSEMCRSYWKEFVKGIHVMVWVVDSTANEARLEENANELRKFLKLEAASNIPILFVASKQDRENALPPEEVMQQIQAYATAGASRKCAVVGTEVIPGGRRKGIWDSYQHLVSFTS
ncbi:uncharacterized protein LOC133202424 isoform X2 [Saccostrea echinata]|uniref:uncharacterized protein LOC133202424 isoform X2 n=1 Tax=Saccostrea echinata TaxID=191078 RepID=UPI002A820AAE|nr:uncharacterized protein LOC133202424 isoform X2 [Saccostrea echinata]